jgi:hypothetical protein
MAAIGRRAELRAAALGFVPMPAEVLHTMHLGERARTTRPHHLRPYL